MGLVDVSFVVSEVEPNQPTKKDHLVRKPNVIILRTIFSLFEISTWKQSFPEPLFPKVPGLVGIVGIRVAIEITRIVTINFVLI